MARPRIEDPLERELKTLMRRVALIQGARSGKLELRRIEKSLGPYASEHLANKADMGVNRNLNHERFFTRIESKP